MAPRRRKHSVSSKNDESPLKLKQKQTTENDFDNLIQYSTEKCEFCDSQFNNRYKCLIHTAKHIIIPLINNQIFRCKICLFCFTSQKEMTEHMKKVHPTEHLTEIIKHAVMNNVKIQCENLNLTPVNASQHSDNTRQNIAKKTKVNKQNSNGIIQGNDSGKCSDSEQPNLNGKTNCDIDPVKEMLKQNGIHCNDLESHRNVQNAASRPSTMLKQLLLQPNKPMTNIAKFNIADPILNQSVILSKQLTNQPIVIPNQQSNLLNQQTPQSFANQLFMLNVPTNMLNQSNQMLTMPQIMMGLPGMQFTTPTVVGSPIIINDLTDEQEEEFILPDISPKVPHQKPQASTQKEVVPTTPTVSMKSDKPQTPNIKNRLVFEEDLIDIPNPPQKTYLTVKKLPMNTPNTSHNTQSNGERILKSNVITIVNGVIKKPYIHTIDLSEPEIQYKSVHYDELMRPGMYGCKHCGLTYPNRFDVIVHGTANHLQIKNKINLGALHCSICDWYIAGNHYSLKRHVKDYHDEDEIKNKRQCNTCSKCKLKYSHKARHYRIYHPMELVGRSEDSEDDALAQAIPPTKVVYDSQLCDVCSMFMKNNSRVKFKSAGVLQEYGMKYKCTNCKNIVDAVETFTVYRTVQSRGRAERRDKTLSNEDRLKKIQCRLRMIEKNKKF